MGLPSLSRVNWYEAISPVSVGNNTSTTNVSVEELLATGTKKVG